MKKHRHFGLLTAMTAVCPQIALAFSVVASPPRAELEANAGEVVRQVLEIANTGKSAQELSIKTLDWKLNAQSGVEMQEALAENSCRPWVRLERPQVVLGANAKFTYRYEVHVPKDTPAQECAFMIAIEGLDSGATQAMPVAGRLGVVIYVRVGDAKAKITQITPRAGLYSGKKWPGIEIKNEGNAHTRFEGFLKVTDSAGQTFDVSPSTFPVLGNETRWIFLQPETNVEKWGEIKWPLRFSGKVYSGKETWTIDVELK